MSDAKIEDRLGELFTRSMKDNNESFTREGEEPLSLREAVDALAAVVKPMLEAMYRQGVDDGQRNLRPAPLLAMEQVLDEAERREGGVPKAPWDA